jgi:hypothetical protein
MTDNEPNDPRLNWSAWSQAERDAACDNNKAVANSPTPIAARSATSAKALAMHPGTLDVAYGTGERTKFDLYPAEDRSAPCRPRADAPPIRSFRSSTKGRLSVSGSNRQRREIASDGHPPRLPTTARDCACSALKRLIPIRISCRRCPECEGNQPHGVIRRSIHRLVADDRSPLSCLSYASLLLHMSFHVDAEIGRTEGVRQ